MLSILKEKFKNIFFKYIQLNFSYAVFMFTLLKCVVLGLNTCTSELTEELEKFITRLTLQASRV